MRNDFYLYFFVYKWGDVPDFFDYSIVRKLVWIRQNYLAWVNQKYSPFSFYWKLNFAPKIKRGCYKTGKYRRIGLVVRFQVLQWSDPGSIFSLPHVSQNLKQTKNWSGSGSIPPGFRWFEIIYYWANVNQKCFPGDVLNSQMDPIQC